MTSNLWALVEPSLKQHAARPAWICRQRDGNRIVHYREIYEAALCTACDLRKAGVTKGDTVGVTAPNGPEWTVAALATFRIGAILAPVHIGNSEQEIKAQVDAIDPKVMLVFGCGLDYSNHLPISLQVSQDKIDSELAIAAADDTNAVAVRIYTSGSTGSPKVVRLSHGNLVSNVLAAVKLESFTHRDRFLSLLPLSHAMGITGNFNLPYYVGATLIVPRVLAANEILATIQEEKVTVVVAVPRLFRNVMHGLEARFNEGGLALSLYRKLLKALPKQWRHYVNGPIRNRLGGRIKIWISGGSHLDGRISRYYHDLGLPLRQGYGLTETSPLACVQDNFDDAVDSVGRPVEKVEVRVTGTNHEGVGEIWLRGPNVMIGYDDPEQTAEVLKDGWFKTGDIGRVDDEGKVTLTGRSKRLIVTDAGKNVYPEELETLLERNPVVREAGVIEENMKPVCILAMQTDDPVFEARSCLREFNALVSSHNQITRFAVVEELPRTPLGKIALQELPRVFAENEVGPETAG